MRIDFAKVAHDRARPPGFSILFFRLFDVHCPASFSWAGISILARMRQNAGQSGMDKRPGEICLFGPPGWASSRARVPFSIPLDSFCLMKTRPVRVQRVDRGRAHSTVVNTWASCNASGPHEANPVMFCSVMYWPRPPDSTWSSPHQTNRQGRCGGLLEFVAVEWPTRTLCGSPAS